MAGTQSPQEVELLARFPRGFQQDMIADIAALPEPERTFRMDNFIKNYQLQVKGWKVHLPAQPAPASLLHRQVCLGWGADPLLSLLFQAS